MKTESRTTSMASFTWGCMEALGAKIQWKGKFTRIRTFIAACRVEHAIPTLHTLCRIRKAEILLNCCNPLWSCLQVRSFESSNREIGFGATGCVWMGLKGSEWGDRVTSRTLETPQTELGNPFTEKTATVLWIEFDCNFFVLKFTILGFRSNYIYPTFQRIVLLILVQRDWNVLTLTTCISNSINPAVFFEFVYISISYSLQRTENF